jgi:3-deoxy-D-manno-octulosonic-acid transferase
MNETIQPETDIYIADTLGEMSIFFDLARYVFIAGSLVPVGGHNPIEPAHFDCAIFFGPLMAKNQEIANEMIQTEAAIQIASDESLPHTLEELLTDDDLSQKLSCNARKYAEDGGTILETISIKISPYIVGIK